MDRTRKKKILIIEKRGGGERERNKEKKNKQRSINAQCADVLNSFTIQVASLARRSG